MSKNAKKVIVNALTLSRIIGAFVVPFIFATVNTRFLIILLILLFVTDFLDGKLSRLWEVSTVGGSLLDPLGDKLLAISCILSLISTHIDYLILLLFELVIVFLNVYRTLHGENVRSTFKGKFKTWVLSITIVLGAIHLFRASLINDILSAVGLYTEMFMITDNILLTFLIVTGICEIFTLISYVGETIKNRNNFKKTIKIKPFKDLFARLFDENLYKDDVNKPLVDIIREEG